MFESLQPRGRQNLEMKIVGKERIIFEDESYEVFDTGEREYLMDGDVEVHVLKFLDKKLAERIDAALIFIKPGKSTPIQSWLGERIFIEAIVEGSATWVGVLPGGEVVVYELNADRNDNGINVYGAGFIGTSIAGPRGAAILEVCNPIFVSDQTTIEARLGDEQIGDLAIPQRFQAIYMSLMGLDGK